MPGPPKKPTKLKLLEGNPGHQKLLPGQQENLCLRSIRADLGADRRWNGRRGNITETHLLKGSGGNGIDAAATDVVSAFGAPGTGTKFLSDDGTLRTAGGGASITGTKILKGVGGVGVDASAPDMVALFGTPGTGTRVLGDNGALISAFPLPSAAGVLWGSGTVVQSTPASAAQVSGLITASGSFTAATTVTLAALAANALVQCFTVAGTTDSWFLPNSITKNNSTLAVTVAWGPSRTGYCVAK